MVYFLNVYFNVKWCSPFIWPSTLVFGNKTRQCMVSVVAASRCALHVGLFPISIFYVRTRLPQRTQGNLRSLHIGKTFWVCCIFLFWLVCVCIMLHVLPIEEM